MFKHFIHAFKGDQPKFPQMLCRQSKYQRIAETGGFNKSISFCVCIIWCYKPLLLCIFHHTTLLFPPNCPISVGLLWRSCACLVSELHQLCLWDHEVISRVCKNDAHVTIVCTSVMIVNQTSLHYLCVAKWGIAVFTDVFGICHTTCFMYACGWIMTVKGIFMRRRQGNA